jgi:hypothetical protein
MLSLFSGNISSILAVLCSKIEKSATMSSVVLFILIIRIVSQINALLGTLELQESAKHKGHFALFDGLGRVHTKYNDVQPVCSDSFTVKTLA